jgi:hypothetical protein
MKFLCIMGAVVAAISLLSVIPIGEFLSSSHLCFCYLSCEQPIPLSYPIALVGCPRTPSGDQIYYEVFLMLFENMILFEDEILFLFLFPVSNLGDLLFMRAIFFLVLFAVNYVSVLTIHLLLELSRRQVRKHRSSKTVTINQFS